MTQACPELDEDTLNARDGSAYSHYRTWEIAFFQWLQNHQAPDPIPARAFPLPMSAYLQLTRATQYLTKAAPADSKKEAPPTSQIDGTPTVATKDDH